MSEYGRVSFVPSCNVWDIRWFEVRKRHPRQTFPVQCFQSTVDHILDMKISIQSTTLLCTLLQMTSHLPINCHYYVERNENCSIWPWEPAVISLSSTRGNSYSQYNAYLECPGMGWTLVNDIRWGNIGTWKWALDSINIPKGHPTEEDKQALYFYTDLRVGMYEVKG